MKGPESAGKLFLLTNLMRSRQEKTKDDLYHFLFDCSYFRKNFDSLWNLDQESKALLLLRCLLLPVDSMTLTVIVLLVALVIGKI